MSKLFERLFDRIFGASFDRLARARRKGHDI